MTPQQQRIINQVKVLIIGIFGAVTALLLFMVAYDAWFK